MLHELSGLATIVLAILTIAVIEDTVEKHDEE